MSIGETHVTVVGWVGSEVQFKEVSGGTGRVTFRMGSTPRAFDRSQGTWTDRPTTWFNVECWRVLAQNVFDSVHLGQPIIVSGRLRTHEWIDESGEHRSRVVLDAAAIGHDLSRGTTTFAKNPPRSETPAGDLRVMPATSDSAAADQPGTADSEAA